MTNNRFEFLGLVWLYPGMAGWHFISLPIERSAEIKGRDILMRRGFGAVKVAITIGKTSWRTSIFPDKKSGQYVLPVKADVRKKEKIVAGDKVSVVVEIVEKGE